MYYRYLPKPPLSDFVESFWLYEVSTPTTHTMERILPQGAAQLIINLRDDRFRLYDQADRTQFRSVAGSVIVGVYSEFFTTDTDQQSAVLGVSFKPGGANPFFKWPLYELQNVHLALETAWGNQANELRERLLAAPTPQRKFQLLEDYLTARFSHRLPRQPVVAFALKEFEELRPIAQVAGQIGLSHKHFIEVFRREVGLTPKTYWRIRRFQAALALTRSGQPVEWRSLALGCGYFDQAHFIHDFEAFAGFTPTGYLARPNEHPNHVPLFDQG